MGLAVLPARLKDELSDVAEKLAKGERVEGVHAEWAETLAKQYSFTPENAADIVKAEVGKVFAQVLEHAGVFKRTPEGRAAFLRFIAGT